MRTFVPASAWNVTRSSIVAPSPMTIGGAFVRAYRRTLLQPGVCPEPRIADEPHELPDVRPLACLRFGLLRMKDVEGLGPASITDLYPTPPS